MCRALRALPLFSFLKKDITMFFYVGGKNSVYVRKGMGLMISGYSGDVERSRAEKKLYSFEYILTMRGRKKGTNKSWYFFLFH